MGWDFADSDEVVARVAGRSVADIFRAEGEGHFREREATALQNLAERESIVVATGGGAPTNDESRRAIGRGFVVWLSISPESAAARLASDPTTEERPLLADDPAERLRSLLDARIERYREADSAIDVEGLSPEQAAAEENMPTVGGMEERRSLRR